MCQHNGCSLHIRCCWSKASISFVSVLLSFVRYYLDCVILIYCIKCRMSCLLPVAPHALTIVDYFDALRPTAVIELSQLLGGGRYAGGKALITSGTNLETIYTCYWHLVNYSWPFWKVCILSHLFSKIKYTQFNIKKTTDAMLSSQLCTSCLFQWKLWKKLTSNWAVNGDFGGLSKSHWFFFYCDWNVQKQSTRLCCTCSAYPFLAYFHVKVDATYCAACPQATGEIYCSVDCTACHRFHWPIREHGRAASLRLLPQGVVCVPWLREYAAALAIGASPNADF